MNANLSKKRKVRHVLLNLQAASDLQFLENWHLTHSPSLLLMGSSVLSWVNSLHASSLLRVTLAAKFVSRMPALRFVIFFFRKM